MKHYSEIEGRPENPQTYSKIVRISDNQYVVFVEENGQEVALVTFTTTQVGHAVYIDGNKHDQHIWYNNGQRKGLINQSVGLWISGPDDLMTSLMQGTMEVSAA